MSSIAGLALNDLYDTTCMTHNLLSNFYGVYTIIQIVHTKFIEVVLTDYSVFRSSSKMAEKQVAAAASQGKREKKKRSLCENFALKTWLRTL